MMVFAHRNPYALLASLILLLAWAAPTIEMVSVNKVAINQLKSIKDIYHAVKFDRSLVGEGMAEVKAIMADRGQFDTNKDAMKAINIFKLGGDIHGAMSVLDTMAPKTPHANAPDTGIFNNLIDMMAKQQQFSEAMHLLEQMQQLQVPMDKITFGSALSACSKTGEWETALELLELMVERGISPDTICYASVISACANAGEIDLIVRLLDDMKRKKVPADSIIYNIVIKACSVQRDYETTRRLLEVMKSENIKRDSYTYTACITACGVAGEPGEALRLLQAMAKEGIEPTTVPYNAALHALFSCGKCKQGVNLFKWMVANKICTNTVTYTTVIIGLVKDSLWNEVLAMFDYISRLGHTNAKPWYNSAILNAVISAAEKVGEFDRVLELFIDAKREKVVDLDTSAYNAAMLATRGRGFKPTKMIFDEMILAGIPRNIISYNNLISACKEEGLYQQAMDLMDAMKQDDSYVATSMSSSSAAASQPTAATPKKSDSANKDSIIRNNSISGKRLQPDTVTYSTAISVCVASQQWGLALDLLYEMEREDVSRNVVTYNSVIEALSQAGETVRSELVYQSAIRCGIYDHWHPESPHFDTLESFESLPTCAEVELDFDESERSKAMLQKSGNCPAHTSAAETQEMLPVEKLASLEEGKCPMHVSALETDSGALPSQGGCPAHRNSVNGDLEDDMKDDLNDEVIEVPKGKCPAHGNIAEVDNAVVAASSVSHLDEYGTDENQNKGNAKLERQCPAHVNAVEQDSTEFQSTEEITSHQDGVKEGVSSTERMGKCPAHIDEAGAGIPAIQSVKQGKCPAHTTAGDRQTFESEDKTTSSSQSHVNSEVPIESSTKGKCPAHASDNSKADSDEPMESNLVNLDRRSKLVMDLHHFPSAVAQAAVMHVLGEMCTGVLPIGDPLIIITGKGNHGGLRRQREQRGLLRADLQDYISNLGLQEDLTNDNMGRLYYNRNTVQEWLRKQREDDVTKRASGASAHGNLFLKVAYAKKSKAQTMNVRAVCPFSSATKPSP